jgi:hypothetical protein
MIANHFDEKQANDLLENCTKELKQNFDIFKDDYDLSSKVRWLYEHSENLQKALKHSEMPHIEKRRSIADKYFNIISSYYNEFVYENSIQEDNQSTNFMQGTKKIIWNGQKNALADIFRQLKNMNNSKNQPLIANSYEEIAQFLKDNFVCFENNTISTIVGTLKKNNDNLKQKSKIYISCKDE